MYKVSDCEKAPKGYFKAQTMDIDNYKDVNDMITMSPLEFAEKSNNAKEFWDFCCCCCSRVGSLIVICEAPKKPGQKRNLLCVVGPYW